MKKALVLSGGGARGAFQVGVIKFLQEMAWAPDLICGTSVGAINAAAYGSDMSVERMTRLWQTYRRKRMYRLTVPLLLRSLKSRTHFAPMSDHTAVKKTP